MLIALALQVAVVPPPPRDTFGDRTWGYFSRSPVLSSVSESVDIATAPSSTGTRTLSYTMRLTRRRLPQPDEILWADSRICSAMLPVLRSMQALPPPRPSVPGFEPMPGYIILDGVGYSLRAPAHFAPGGSEGQMSFSSNIGTPLAAWIDHSLAALERCWSSVEPRMR